MLITGCTPTYNRRDTVHRVWESLRAQTCRDFEWVVVDDGSTDGGVEILREYQAAADFPVRIEVQEHGGKHIAWNRGVRAARGELFVPADSDDAFRAEALERFRVLWCSIPEAERASFSGINVLCREPDTGTIVGTAYPGSPMISHNLALAYVHRVRGEKWGCIRTSALREVPFPEDEALRGACVAESYLWFSLARRYRVLCVNEPLRLYYRDAANSIIASRVADGPANRVDGRAPARYFFKSWHLNRNLDYLSRDPRELVKTLLDVWITGLATRGSILGVARDGEGTRPRLLRLAALPVGLIAYWYCRVRGLRRRSEEGRFGVGPQYQAP
jgi:glycosyltransferase involved in cell wall biosynthesis